MPNRSSRPAGGARRGRRRAALAVAVAVAVTVAVALPACLHALAPHEGAGRRAVATPDLVAVVSDTAGAPIAGATVLVVETGRAATTDRDGRVVLLGLPAGRLHLAVSRSGWGFRRLAVDLPEAGGAVTVTIRLAPAAVVLPGVQVTAAASDGDPTRSTQATVVLDGRALQQRQAPSVAQLLANEPGMAMRFNGPMANVPVIRGLTGERIVLLQDGERTGDLAATAADHLQAVDPALAERVEVIRGPASLLYGSNAIGGVVNVVSGDIPASRPETRSGWLAGQAESVAPGGVGSAGGVVPLGGGFVATGRASWRRMSDLRAGGGLRVGNTDASTWSGSGGLAWFGPRGSLGVAVRTQDFDYGVPAPDAEAVRIAGDRRAVQLRGEFTPHLGWLPSVRLDATAQSYAHDEVEPGGVVGTRLALDTRTVTLLARTRTGALRGTVGVQGFFRRYGATGDETFTPAAANDQMAVLLHQELAVGPVRDGDRRATVQVGARHDLIRLVPRTSDDPRFASLARRRFGTTSGSLGVTVPFAGGASLAASVARAFRAPTVEELWANGFHAAVNSFDIGTPTLRPELATGGDLVFRVQRRGGFAQLAAHATALDGYVLPLVGRDTTLADFGTVPIVTIGQVAARLAGAELSGEAALGRRLVLGGVADVVRGRGPGGSALPFMPAARLGSSLRWDARTWAVGADVRHTFAQRAVAAENVPAFRNPLDLATGDFTLVNLQASWTLPTKRMAHVLTVRVDNLLDVRYVDATSRIKAFGWNPGRNIVAGWRVQY